MRKIIQCCPVKAVFVQERQDLFYEQLFEENLID
jgi:hypothetical protein